MKTHQCQNCGRYSKYEELDSYTPFGCADPGDPEPYDPIMLCAKCSNSLYETYKSNFKKGLFKGDWQKSNAEIKAATECNLLWVGSFSETIAGKKYHNEWVPISLINGGNE